MRPLKKDIALSFPSYFISIFSSDILSPIAVSLLSPHHRRTVRKARRSSGHNGDRGTRGGAGALPPPPMPRRVLTLIRPSFSGVNHKPHGHILDILHHPPRR